VLDQTATDNRRTCIDQQPQDARRRRYVDNTFTYYGPVHPRGGRQGRDPCRACRPNGCPEKSFAYHLPAISKQAHDHGLEDSVVMRLDRRRKDGVLWFTVLVDIPAALRRRP
jgi:hypothetical protein